MFKAIHLHDVKQQPSLLHSLLTTFTSWCLARKSKIFWKKNQRFSKIQLQNCPFACFKFKPQNSTSWKHWMILLRTTITTTTLGLRSICNSWCISKPWNVYHQSRTNSCWDFSEFTSKSTSNLSLFFSGDIGTFIRRTWLEGFHVCHKLLHAGLK